MDVWDISWTAIQFIFTSLSNAELLDKDGAIRFFLKDSISYSSKKDQ